MKRFLSISLILFVIFWSAGYRSQKPESNAQIEIIDGVEYIHNTETPLYPDKTVTFEEDLFISGEDQDGNIILFKPRLDLVDDNENIYIIDRQDHVIKVFDSYGKFIRTIGSKGSGPGEFQLIGNIDVTKDGKLLVTGEIARRTSFFDSSGKFIKSFRWISHFSSCYLVKNSSYLTAEIISSNDRQFTSLYIVELDFDGKEIRTYGKFTWPQSKISRQGNVTHFISNPFSPASIFAGDQSRGWLYHCLNNKYIIEVYDTSGKLFRKIDRPYKPVPFTSKDVEEYRAGLESNSSALYRKLASDIELPKVKNVVEKMHVDDEGNLWIRTNERREEDDKILTAYDIFSSDGLYYARIWTPVLPLLFKKGKMYRMEIDPDTGYKSLKRYNVIWIN